MSPAGLRVRNGQEAPVTAGPASDAILTRAQVARWLQLRPRQLDRLGVPCLNLGHKTKRYVQEDVQAWLDEQRQLSSRRRSAVGLDVNHES